MCDERDWIDLIAIFSVPGVLLFGARLAWIKREDDLFKLRYGVLCDFEEFWYESSFVESGAVPIEDIAEFNKKREICQRIGFLFFCDLKKKALTLETMKESIRSAVGVGKLPEEVSEETGNSIRQTTNKIYNISREMENKLKLKPFIPGIPWVKNLLIKLRGLPIIKGITKIILRRKNHEKDKANHQTGAREKTRKGR